MDLLRIVYSSVPFGYDSAVLSGVLMDARRANQRDGITGALICREDIYLQWLEGPEPAVRAALTRIARDDRHVDLQMHVDEATSERLFGEWAMLHDPATSLIWSLDEVASGAVERAEPEEIVGFFQNIARADPPPNSGPSPTERPTGG